MTVLLEGMSLVFENRVLEDRFPHGVTGFRAIFDNGSFCSDGTISRISFFESKDAFCVLMGLPDYDIEVSTDFAINVGVFLHGGRPWVPCLWLETSFTADGMCGCWHANESRDPRPAVPSYFRPNNAFARYGQFDEAAIMRKVGRAGTDKGVSLFRDLRTQRMFAGPSPLCRH